MVDATEMLNKAQRGDDRATGQLLNLTYDELRRCAEQHLRSERPDHTLQPTALVHEAYVKIVRQDKHDWKGKTHFMAVAALSMRQVLVDHANQHKAQKRGGGLRRVSLTDTNALVLDDNGIDLLDLDAALTKLKQHDATYAKLVELRFFGGLGIDQIADLLDLSPRSVKRYWRMARAWLLNTLSEHDDEASEAHA